MIATIINEIRLIKQKDSELKKFGITFFFICVFIAGIVFYKHDFNLTRLTIVSGIIGLFFLITGLLFPLVLKFFHKIWMTLAIIMGYFTSNIIHILAFFLFITPGAILLRIAGKDILDLKKDTEQKTFWKNYTKIDDKERYKKMF